MRSPQQTFTRTLAVLFVLTVIVSLGAAVLPANGAVSTGCQGMAKSFDEQGRLVDRVTAPGPGGTQDNPFAIDPDGRIDWAGSTDAVITDGTWEVATIGLSFGGDMDNSDKKNAYSGTVAIGDDPALNLPLQLILSGNSTVRVDGALSGDGGNCTGFGYITGVGGAAFTPMWWTALIMLIAGIALMLRAMFGTTTSQEVTTATQQAVAEGALDDFLPRAGTGAGQGGTP